MSKKAGLLYAIFFEIVVGVLGFVFLLSSCVYCVVLLCLVVSDDTGYLYSNAPPKTILASITERMGVALAYFGLWVVAIIVVLGLFIPKNVDA